MSANDLGWLDAVALRDLVADGEVTPAELAKSAIARIEAHYFKHEIFLPENFLLDNIDRSRKIPAVIVQGRYDIVCPPVTADALARAWPEAETIVVPDAGHSVREPGITRELLGAVRRMQHRMGG